MANYWIRNRGRVQGPFTAEQIQGLQRRGRFSRMFHVSEDNKSWHPAEDFPELFERARKSRSSRQDDDDFEDTPFNSGGSPFDDDEDDYAPPKKRS
ncbi:MAG: GYF domain-containing protein, partial [Fuerstiella sp.]